MMSDSSRNPNSNDSGFLHSISPLPLLLGKSNIRGKDGRKLTSKERKYYSNIERALASFDSVEEWADYISFLGKLERALQTNPDPKSNHWIPYSFKVSKLLAQCISSKLPGGVHLKALEVYQNIFDILGNKQLSGQCQLWIPGILPLMSYASINVKPAVIKMYRDYLSKIGKNYLRTIFKPILLSLFPALDDITSEFFDSIIQLIELFHAQLDNNVHFWQCVLLCILTSADKRGGAMQYCLKYLPSFKTAEQDTSALSQEAKDCINPEAGLLVRAFCQGLKDENILVQRGFFDIMLSKLPLDSPVIQIVAPEHERQNLVLTAATTSLRRDMSLNRRLWSWLLGTESSNMTPMMSAASETSSLKQGLTRSEYFNRYGYKYLSGALLSLLDGETGSDSRETQIIKACRICVSLMDKWEIAQLIIPQMFIPILHAIYDMSKKIGLTESLMKSANAFFDGVEAYTIWSKLYKLERKGEFQLLLFVVQKFHIDDEDMVTIYIPLTVLSLLCLKANDITEDWLELLKQLSKLIPERAFQSLNGADKEYTTNLQAYDTDIFAKDILKNIDTFYTAEDKNSSNVVSPFTPANLSALILGFVSHRTASLLKSDDGEDFRSFCGLTCQLFDSISDCKTQWKDPCLLNGIESIDSDSFTDSDVSIAFGCAMLFDDVTANLPILKKLQILKLVITLLWKCLIHSSGEYQVEAAQKLWALERSINASYIEAGLCKLFNESDEFVRIKAFNILWTQFSSTNGTDAILGHPLYIILDDLRSNRKTDRILISKWLEGTLTSGTFNKILKICCTGLLSHYNFITFGEFANNETDDFGLFNYELGNIYSLLTLSEDILPAFKSELCIIDRDYEIKIINDNRWDISTYKSLVLAILMKFISLDSPQNLDQETFSMFCSCMKCALDVLCLLIDGTEKNFNAIVSLLAKTCGKFTSDDTHHLINAYLVGSLTQLMKLSSKKQLKVALFVAPKPGQQNTLFLEFVSSGIGSSVTTLELHYWLVFILEVAEYYSELSFSVVTDITSCLCNKIRALAGRNVSHKDMGMTNDSICELIDGLDRFLNRSHKYLGYLVRGNFAYGNTENSGTNAKEGSFFGSMIQGVFQVEEPSYKDELQRRRLTLLKAIKISIKVINEIWLQNGGKLEESSSSFPISAKYNASKLKFKSKKFLETMYSIEPLETLETLIGCNLDEKKNSSFRVFRAIDSTAEQRIIPHILDSLMSRISITNVDTEKQSSLLTNLTEKNIICFMTAYIKTIDSEIIMDSWNELSHFFKDASTASGGYRKVYPYILELTAVSSSKALETHLQSQKKVKRDLVDTFVKILNTTLSNRVLQYGSTVNPLTTIISPNLSVENKNEPKSSLSIDLTEQIPDHHTRKVASLEEACPILSSIAFLIPTIVGNDEKCTTCLNLVITNVAAYLVRNNDFQLNPGSIADLVNTLSDLPQACDLRAWKTFCYETLESSSFFKLKEESRRLWSPVLSPWIIGEQNQLEVLIGKLSTYVNATSSNIFGWSDSESNAGIDSLKRISYLLLISPTDTFITLESKLQDQLCALFNSSNNSGLKSYLFMVVRAIVLRFSEVHITTFWPIIYTELEGMFEQLLGNLLNLKIDDDDQLVDLSAFDNRLVLQGCKLLDVLLVLGPENFQLDEWLFVDDNSDAVYGRGEAPIISVIDKIKSIKNFKAVEDSNSIKITSAILNSKRKEPLLLGIRKINRIFELKPFMDKLSVYKYEIDYEMRDADVDVMVNDAISDLFIN